MNLTINSVPQVFDEKPASGLRIKEIGKKETYGANQSVSQAASQAPDNNTNTPPIVANISDIGKFACEFLRRCRASSAGDEEAACFLTESVVKAASEISSELGQDKGAEFLNKIMEFTEQGLSENRLSGAISAFFDQFRKEALTNGDLNTALFKLSNSFNRGLDIFIDKDNMLPERLDKGEIPGLAFAMNNFFSTDYTVDEYKANVTTMGFNYFNGAIDRIELKYAKEPEWLEDGPAGPGYYTFVGTGQSVTASELIGSETDDTLLKATDYLRTEIGNEKAAAFLEALTADSNVMEAIASTIAIVAMENGFDQAVEYVGHLNGNMKNAINSVAPKDVIYGGWTIGSPLKYSNDPNSLFRDPKTGLELGVDMSDIFKKGHVGLYTSWRNTNGVGVLGPAKDLNELYSRFKLGLI